MKDSARTARRSAAGLAIWCVLSTSSAWAQTDATLSAALRAGDLAAVSAALDAGADPNPDASVPPLYIASLRGDLDIVRELLSRGAAVDAPDPKGRSPLVAALLRGHLDVAEHLIAAGADVNLPETSPGRSPLMLVIDEAPSIQAMALLLDAGADIDQQDARGETPLAAAAFMNRPEALTLLIERGVDLGAANHDGVTPLEWARRQGHGEIVRMLTDAGASGQQ